MPISAPAAYVLQATRLCATHPEGIAITYMGALSERPLGWRVLGAAVHASFDPSEPR